jgi:hypothetical protein
MGLETDSAAGPEAAPVRRAFWRLERFWIVGNLAYSAFRIVLAWRFLANHGLSVWGFALVELISAVPWAISTSRITRALIKHNHRHLLAWCLLATASFLAPDAFVIATTHHVPTWIYVVIACWVSIAGVASVRKVLVSGRERRAAGA